MATETVIQQAPKEITEKHTWCNKTYEKKVLLMVKEN